MQAEFSSLFTWQILESPFFKPEAKTSYPRNLLKDFRLQNFFYTKGWKNFPFQHFHHPHPHCSPNLCLWFVGNFFSKTWLENMAVPQNNPQGTRWYFQYILPSWWRRVYVSKRKKPKKNAAMSQTILRRQVWMDVCSQTGARKSVEICNGKTKQLAHDRTALCRGKCFDEMLRTWEIWYKSYIKSF